jgi:hypothetical protein
MQVAPVTGLAASVGAGARLTAAGLPLDDCGAVVVRAIPSGSLEQISWRWGRLGSSTPSKRATSARFRVGPTSASFADALARKVTRPYKCLPVSKHPSKTEPAADPDITPSAKRHRKSGVCIGP